MNVLPSVYVISAYVHVSISIAIADVNAKEYLIKMHSCKHKFIFYESS